MNPLISVILCTHNPRKEYLTRVLAALRAQSLPVERWELLLIDNASNSPVAEDYDLSWHPNARHVREDQLGLAPARVRGIAEARGEVLVFVDDDNVLAPDFVEQAWIISEKHPSLGAWGGKICPEFERTPPPWVKQYENLLALRDFGNQSLISNPGLAEGYPSFGPIGAGLIVRRKALTRWLNSPKNLSGRKGTQLSSCEDHDIVLCVAEEGWALGYCPELQLTHLIPATRFEPEYLARLVYHSYRDWIAVQCLHGIGQYRRMAPWTIPLRKIKAYFVCRAWRDPVSRIRWRGFCGIFEALSKVPKTGAVPRPAETLKSIQ